MTETQPAGIAWTEIEGRLSAALADDPTHWHPAATLRPDDEVRRRAHAAAAMIAAAPGGFDWTSPLAEMLTREVGGFLRGLYRAGPDAPVVFTGGGTESIFAAVKAARDRACAKARPGAGIPTILAATSAHPAFEKAARWLGLELRRTGVDRDGRASADDLARAIDANTVMLVASLPSDCGGRCDPVQAIAEIAAERDLWLHVDACLGGLIVPFLKEIGDPLPSFDFDLAGVRSISVDMHKYGYAPIGTSALLLREPADLSYLRFTSATWGGGRLSSDRVSGTASLAPLGGAWTVLSFLGRGGFRDRARRIRDNARELAGLLRQIPGIAVAGPPEAGLVHFTAAPPLAETLPAHLKARGWRGNVTTSPPGFVVCVGPHPTVPELQDYASRLAVEMVPAARNQKAAARGQT